ncbi:histidine kinase [Actinobaculum sp. 313]|uniref:sensor histidine kinase n=1 Tax=Actinobaculum sp. 313 TaxID=2495645 RepID=UPI000D529563|nr:histidine kinase [Actinobaculum sp. 313]AWE42800.1 two-component sensor histidine kinase [Actinobaculum sp. 313]
MSVESSASGVTPVTDPAVGQSGTTKVRPGPAADTSTKHLTPRAAHPRRNTRRWALILSEFLRAVLWIPLVIVLIPAALVFHLSIPLAAEAQRALARSLGIDAPSRRPSATARGAWLSSRVTTGEFWRQDLPLCLGSIVLTTIDFFVGFVGLIAASTSLALPFVVSPQRPAEAWRYSFTSFEQCWWFFPIGLALLAVVSMVFLAVGRLRGRFVTNLSTDPNSEEMQALTQQVGDLSRGRATLVDAFEAERSRIERDLHDGAQQELVGVTMALGLARVHLEAARQAFAANPVDDPSSPQDSTSSSDTSVVLTAASDHSPGEAADIATVLMPVLADIDAAQDRAEAALRALRETVRGVRPAMLTERGLAAALQELASHSTPPAACDITGDDAAISSPVATTVYFAVAEALTNAAKHSSSSDGAQITLVCNAFEVCAVVSDNGRGGANPAAPSATGLRGIIQRVESMGGTVTIDSPIGVGTTVTITAPTTPPWRD